MFSNYRRRLARSLGGCRLGLSFALCLFECGFSLNAFGYFIPLSFLDAYHREPADIMESWGFSYYSDESAFHLSWGRHCKIVHMPWAWNFLKGSHHVQRADGTWAPYIGEWDGPDGRHKMTFPFTYTLKSGEIQGRIATVYVERREWRRRALMWLPLFAMKRTSLNVEFSDEVGERTGSWKGGCVGCSCDLLPGDTPETALRRMERERIFS